MVFPESENTRSGAAEVAGIANTLRVSDPSQGHTWTALFYSNKGLKSLPSGTARAILSADS